MSSNSPTPDTGSASQKSALDRYREWLNESSSGSSSNSPPQQQPSPKPLRHPPASTPVYVSGSNPPPSNDETAPSPPAPKQPPPKPPRKRLPSKDDKPRAAPPAPPQRSLPETPRPASNPGSDHQAAPDQPISYLNRHLATSTPGSGRTDQDPTQHSSPSRSPSKLLRTPRKLIKQMSFKSLLPSPTPQPEWSQESTTTSTPGGQRPSDSGDGGGSTEAAMTGESGTCGSGGTRGMDTLFGTSPVNRPPATRQESRRESDTAPLQPIGEHPPLYEVDLATSNGLRYGATQIDEKPRITEQDGHTEPVMWEYHTMDGRRGWWVVMWAFLASFVSLSALFTYTAYESYYEATNMAATSDDTATTEFMTRHNPAVLTNIHEGQLKFDHKDRRFSHKASTYSVLIGTLMAGFASLFSAPAGIAADLFGYRICCFAGTVVMCIGLFASSFIDHLAVLCVLQGVVCGLGIAMVFVPAYTAPAHWFDRHRALATGVAVAGAGIGVAVLTPIYRLILRHRGMSMALRVQALVTLVIGAFASVGLRTRVEVRRAQRMDWHLVRDPRMLALMAISLFGSASRFAQFYCLPAFAMSQGKSEEDGMSIIYTMSAFSVLGVVVGGFLADRSGYIAGIGLSQLAMGLFTLVLWTPSTTALAPMFVYAILSGISSGILAAVFPPSIAQMFGISRLATTAGLVLAACMPAILATTPAATEFLTLAAGNRSTAWLIALSGVLSLVAGFIGLFLPLLQRRHVAQSVRKQTSGAWMQ